MLKAAVPSNAPFVGRRVELDQLHRTLGSVITAKKPNFVLIQGDIGVGKTALVERFLAEATAQYPSALIGLGKCAMETELNGLIPLGQLLAQLTGQAIQRRIWPGNGSDFAQEFAPAWIGFSSVAAQAPSYLSALRQNITRLFELEELRTLCFDLGVDFESLGGEGKEAKARELVAFLDRNDRLLDLVETCASQRPGAAWQSILETARAAHASRSSQPEPAKEAAALLERGVFSQENLFVQFTNALSRLAENRPVIAVIEDLHWADASSLHLLFHLARNLQNRAVLFVCTHRLIESQKTSSNIELLREIRANIIEGAIRLDLRDGIDVAEYVAQRYPRNTFPPDLIARIRQQTEGHALFDSQLFSWWEATGRVVAAAGPDGQPVWELAGAADASPTIPPTMNEVLEERIRSMANDLREILTCASVEGDDFTVQVITRLRQLDEYKTYDSLETLSQQYRLIQERGTGEVGSTVLDFYRFVHRFFREYIYSQLSSGKRRILHRQVGECMEALYSDRRPIAGQLALHFREAHDHLKAARYALMAAQFEQSRYAWAEGEKWCQFGLARIDETAAETKPLQLDLLEQSGYGDFASGQLAQAEGRYRAALALAQQLQTDVERIALIYERLSDIADDLERTEEALTLVEQGRQILAGHATPHNATYFKLEATWAGTQSALGNYDLAIQHLQRILAEAEQLPPTPQLDRVRASAYNELALAFTSMNQYAQSLAASQKAIAAGSTVASRSQAIGLLDMSMTYFNLGQVEESMACILKGLELARQIGDLGQVAYGQASKGFLLLAQGKPGEAVTELTEAIALSERISVAWGMDDMHADLAMAYLALSDLERADQSARRGLAYAEQTQDHFKLGYALDALARVEAARQEWESALHHFNQAIDHYKQGRNPDFVAQAQCHLAEALLGRGDRQQAAELLQAALATYQALELPHDVAETQRLLQQAV